MNPEPEDDGYHHVQWSGRRSTSWQSGYETGKSDGYAEGFRAAYDLAVAQWAEVLEHEYTDPRTVYYSKGKN